MRSNAAQARRDVRYEPDESPPNLLSLGLGMQYAMLAVSGIVLSPTILIHTTGGSDAYLMWAVCAALAICGVTTAVQAVGVGRIGAGYVLLMGSSSAFLAVSVAALEQGGPGAAGHAHRRSVPVPVRPRGQVVSAAADIHPDGSRDRHHAEGGAAVGRGAGGGHAVAGATVSAPGECRQVRTSGSVDARVSYGWPIAAAAAGGAVRRLRHGLGPAAVTRGGDAGLARRGYDGLGAGAAGGVRRAPTVAAGWGGPPGQPARGGDVRRAAGNAPPLPAVQWLTF